MADRYWVGGTASWDGTAGTKWAATSGGPGGESVPTSADDVFFDNLSTGTVTVATGNTGAKSINCTGFTGTMTGSGSISVAGSITLVAGMTYSRTGGTTTITGTGTITSAGKTFSTFTVDGVGAIVTLADALVSTGVFNLTNGTIALGSQTLTAIGFSSSNSNARTIDFGTGKIVLTGTSGWTVSTATNMTISGTPVVDMTYSGGVSVAVSAGFAAVGNTVSFNFTAGNYALAISGNVRSLNFTGFNGALSIGSRSVAGSIVFSSGMTVSAGASATTFIATSGGNTITTNGKTLDFPVTFNGVGGAWQLQDALTLGSTRTLTLSAGAIDLNGKTLTVGTFSSSNSGVRTLTMTGASAVVLGSGAAAWTMATSTNATVNASGSTISMTSASDKTFQGGGRTYGTLNQGGAGVLTVVGNNTFANITNTVQPATVRLTFGSTQTVSAFTLSGTPGNLITLDTTSAGSRATLSDASGTVSVSNVSIKDINATGGATWNAFTADGNVDGGNNLGWNFAAVVASGGAVFRAILRSVFKPILSQGA